MVKKAEDYQTLETELNGVLAALQQPDVAVDAAVVLYEKGIQLTSQLETLIQDAEHKLETLRLQYNQDDAA